MSLIHKPLLLSSAIAGLMLAGCASTPKAPPAFNPNASAAAQAATFIGDNGQTKALPTVKRVVMTGCNVLFAEVSSASASTGGGMFSHVGSSYSNTARVEARESVVYKMEGISDAQQQKIADSVCSDAETRLKNAGFDVVPKSELLANENFKALIASGKPSPFNYKAPGKGSSTTYNVFAPAGYTVYDPRYIGTLSNLGQAFKQAGGKSAVAYQAKLMQELKASSVSVNVLVDFAELQSDGHQRGILSKDSASVKHGVNLGITGQIIVLPLDLMKCYKGWGNTQNCMSPPGKETVLSSKLPITITEKFYKDVVNATTTGDKVASGLTKGIAVLGAMGGMGGLTGTSITRYSVNVEPAQFETIARKGVDGFLDMAFITAKSPAKK